MDEAEPARDLEAPDAKAVHNKQDGLNGSNNAQGDGSDSEDDAAPDYGALAALASKMRPGQSQLNDEDRGEGSSNGGKKPAAPFIPKRGEKDFEPTGFSGQSKALEASRKAMFQVLSCERYISSKAISIATWEPTLNRAIVHLARGQTFGSMGYANRVAVLDDGQYKDLAEIYTNDKSKVAPVVGSLKDGVWWPKLQSRLELYPEEALYLVERGSLECRVFTDDSQGRQRYVAQASYELSDFGGDKTSDAWAPMSVEQAYSTLLGREGLSRERYQLYAHLKRLGYIVQRKSHTDALRASVSAQRLASNVITSNEINGKVRGTGIIADPERPIRLVTITDLLLYPFRRIVQLAMTGLRELRKIFAALYYRSLLALPVRPSLWMPRAVSPGQASSHASSPAKGRGLLNIGDSKSTTYDAVFDRLRIVPTGHDRQLEQSAQTKKESGLEIFFYAWRPATHFKKTDPPLPEFELATADARHTTLPSIYTFAHLFAQLPAAMNTDKAAELSEHDKMALQRAQEEKKRNDQSYGRKAAVARKANASQATSDEGKSPRSLRSCVKALIPSALRPALAAAVRRLSMLLHLVGRHLAHLPPGCVRAQNHSHGGRRGPGPGGRRPVNVYGPLKAGRRNVVVAVNDCGTTSLLRFGESDFARWRIAGTGHA